MRRYSRPLSQPPRQRQHGFGIPARAAHSRLTGFGWSPYELGWDGNGRRRLCGDSGTVPLCQNGASTCCGVRSRPQTLICFGLRLLYDEPELVYLVLSAVSRARPLGRPDGPRTHHRRHVAPEQPTQARSELAGLRQQAGLNGRGLEACTMTREDERRRIYETRRRLLQGGYALQALAGIRHRLDVPTSPSTREPGRRGATARTSSSASCAVQPGSEPSVVALASGVEPSGSSDAHAPPMLGTPFVSLPLTDRTRRMRPAGRMAEGLQIPVGEGMGWRWNDECCASLRRDEDDAQEGSVAGRFAASVLPLRLAEEKRIDAVAANLTSPVSSHVGAHPRSHSLVRNRPARWLPRR
uniref:Uncharacterized protein n=1 Tax=Mycena chlorophos TaxID=658473 RepID=A0ABQ0LH22_MYCCL|nr:predicted protein [Mycena chlorophos]